MDPNGETALMLHKTHHGFDSTTVTETSALELRLKQKNKKQTDFFFFFAVLEGKSSTNV